MIIDVCVIGVGGIGKFHLKSSINAGFCSVGIDPVVESENNIRIFKDFEDILANQIRLFIISTNAKLHFNYLERINEYFPKSVIIIEKPLFSNKREYLLFNSINQRHEGNIFINLPFLYSGQFLSTKIDDLGNLISYRASGGNWGLACNILHDISIIAKIKGDIYAPKEVSTVVKSILNSKREGYLEVLGEINFLFDNVAVELIAGDGPSDKTIEICFEKGEIILDFKALTITTPLGQSPLVVPRASTETGRLISRIFKSENLNLILAEKYITLSEVLYASMATASGTSSDGNYPFS
jgi:hypothetical protein